MNFKIWLELKDEFLQHQNQPDWKGQKSIEQVAEEFYDYQKGQFPTCKLGIAGESQEKVGSGNCAWTARRFITWAALNSKKNPEMYGKAKIIFFPINEREKLAHIVPVYDNHIIDYILAFTKGKKYQITPVKNTQTGPHSIEEGGLAQAYPMYDEYVIGSSIQDVNNIIAKMNFKVNTFDRPTNKPTYQYEPWQLGQ